VRKESLNTKILILTTSLFVVCSLIYGIFFSYQSKTALMDEFVTRGNSLLKNLALNAEVEILIENREALNSLAENLLQEKDVRSVKIIGDNEQVLVDIAKPGQLRNEHKETMSVYVSKGSDQNISDRFTLSLSERNSGQPGRDREEIIGYIEAVFSKKGIFDTIDAMRRSMFLAALVATLIGCIIALYYSRSIVKPVRRLASATTRIARGDWESKLPIDSMDEVGQLTQSFNKMSESLIEKRKELEETYKELSKQERMAEIGNFSMMISFL